ncbi:MarR family transcriptional regulator [Nocardiopsis sp. RSe5-2]|uniref:MarR family transcriptional regulator n=1 Tax=Nocardiopsis endophytica TaxID=3018445 RepID=A0ABT4UCY2_9ACTN|nr:MarR family transcriptional regulator [Nocardiopsis endophytica]MDA2814847.1 MarR family transcriptional regulator [Nocardiopsis endophytica]
MTGMDTVEWLSGHEQGVWRSLLRAQSRIESELDRDLQRASGLSLVEYGILVSLSEAEGERMRMRNLADSVIVSKSRLTHQITRLERMGYVRREPCTDDRRGYWAVLTAEGGAALADAARGHVAKVRERVFDRLTPDQVKVLGEVMGALEEP